MIDRKNEIMRKIKDMTEREKEMKQKKAKDEK